MHLRLTRGQTAVVGYGSLLSRASLEKTLKRPYDGYFGPCHVAGWRRVWEASMPNEAFFFRDDGRAVYPKNILYLNVRPDAATDLSAMVFVVESEELAAMHAREWIYEPRVVTPVLRDVTIEGGDAIMYVALPQYVASGVRTPDEGAIRRSYISIVEQGLQGTDAAFREEYARSSDPIPAHLVVHDELDPARPNPWARPT